MLVVDKSEGAWTEVGRFGTRGEAEQNALVLVAAGFDCRIVPTASDIALLVSDTNAERARQELADYAEANRPTATAPPASFPARDSLTGVLLYWCALLFLYSAVSRNTFLKNWLEIGAAQAGLIVGGEWWRTVTALGLHADVGHLLSNLMAGSLFGFFLSSFLGSGLAWLLILLAGGAGNALNAFVQPSTHSAIGASTAIFGAIGLLAVVALKNRPARWTIGLRRWAPLAAGIMLLAFLGMEGERIDVGAHLAGFFVGCVLGMLTLKAGPPAVSPLSNLAFGAAAIAVFLAAWGAAIMQSP